MNELLFGEIKEKEALENILALNQIKKCDKEIEKYTNEIKEQNEKMINILKDEDIDETYIEKIHKYKNLLNNMDGENGRINELTDLISSNEERINDFQNKISEIENKIEELKKEIFDTNDPSRVIECQNEIENNNVRLNDLNDILNHLISDNTPLLIEKEYLTAKNGDLDFNVPNYNKNEITSDLEKITKEFNEAIEKLDLPVRENIEFCQKKINNREIEIDKYNNRKNEVINAYPNSVKLDVEKAYEDIKDLLEELELSHNVEKINENNIFDQEEKEEEPKLEEKEITPEEPVDLKDEMTLLEEKEEPTDTKEVIVENNEENIEVPVDNKTEESIENNKETEEPKEETKNEEEIESVSYVLSDGESLMNIAEKVYPSKDNWEAIYYFNKETIDKYLVSNGISSDFDTIKELASDTSLFTGIKLEIPTDYNYKI